MGQCTMYALPCRAWLLGAIGGVACASASGPEGAATGPLRRGKAAAPTAALVAEPAGPVALPLQLEPSSRVVLARLPWGAHSDRVLTASRMLAHDQPEEANALLGDVGSHAADLLRGRANRLLGREALAHEALSRAADHPLLGPLVQQERGLLAASTGDPQRAVHLLEPLLAESPARATGVALPLARVLAQHAPGRLLDQFPVLEAALDEGNVDARGYLLETKATALDATGRPDEARQVRLQRYLEEPISTHTPTDPPVGLTPTATQQLERAERLLSAHRNERALEAFGAIPDAQLDAQQRCLKRFAVGLAHRKLRQYADAEHHLTSVVQGCSDEDLVRRASYLNAKVVSIRDGLRAIGPIEAFVRRFPDHTMVDDVLFWAADLYQRRGRHDEAAAYYRRAEAPDNRDDHCGDARWRLAWMAYRRGDLEAARTLLERIFLEDGCASSAFDHARARYWLGRIATERGDLEAAEAHFERVMKLSPLSYYAQAALTRLIETLPERGNDWVARLRVPTRVEPLALCPGWLSETRAFHTGLTYLLMGLGDDAAAELLTIDVPEQRVFAGSHAKALGVAAQPVTAKHRSVFAGPCNPAQAELLLILALHRAGAHRQAHWRLRTDFAPYFTRFPSASDVGLWRAAYPLAYRGMVASAENGHDVPSYFLQALAREESAFDAHAVSWAGAYGLTQLLLSTSRKAAALLQPSPAIEDASRLLDPGLNIRLGAAMVGSLRERFAGSLGLALAAYNAGDRVAQTWWRRHEGEPLDVFAEEMTIRETRDYVKRVLRTYGVYLWLYAGRAPVLPVSAALPARGATG